MDRLPESLEAHACYWLVATACVSLAIAWLPAWGYALYCGWVAVGTGAVAESRVIETPARGVRGNVWHVLLAHVWPLCLMKAGRKAG